jgi:hypothetical protein
MHLLESLLILVLVFPFVIGLWILNVLVGTIPVVLGLLVLEDDGIRDIICFHLILIKGRFLAMRPSLPQVLVQSVGPYARSTIHN